MQIEELEDKEHFVSLYVTLYEIKCSRLVMLIVMSENVCMESKMNEFFFF